MKKGKYKAMKAIIVLDHKVSAPVQIMTNEYIIVVRKVMNGVLAHVSDRIVLIKEHQFNSFEKLHE